MPSDLYQVLLNYNQVLSNLNQALYNPVLYIQVLNDFKPNKPLLQANDEPWWCMMMHDDWSQWLWAYYTTEDDFDEQLGHWN